MKIIGYNNQVVHGLHFYFFIIQLSRKLLITKKSDGQQAKKHDKATEIQNIRFSFLVLSITFDVLKVYIMKVIYTMT